MFSARSLLRTNSFLARHLAVSANRQYSQNIFNVQSSSNATSHNLFSAPSVSPVSFTPQYRFLATSSTLSNQTVNCPAFADSITEGDVMLVKEVGDVVSEDDTVMEVETDKTSIPVPAPVSGTIVEILVEEGQTVSPGTPMYVIVAGEGAVPAPEETAAAEKVEAAAPAASEPAAAPAPVAAAPAASNLGAAPKVDSTPVSSSSASDVIKNVSNEDFIEGVGKYSTF